MLEMIRICLIFSLLSLTMAKEFKTSFLTSWDKCIARGKTHCMAEDLMTASCCDFDKKSAEH